MPQMVDSYDSGVLVCFDVTDEKGDTKTFSIADSVHPYSDSVLSVYLLDTDDTEDILNLPEED